MKGSSGTMAKAKSRSSATKNNGATVGYEAQLWQMADTLRGSMDAAEYADVPGFCKSAPLDEVRKHGHVLTPGRYVGAEAQEDDGEPFEEKMKRLTATLREQQAEAAKLDAAIAANLKELGYGG
jgi:type I restriction-modification system DNA methylase subunit